MEMAIDVASQKTDSIVHKVYELYAEFYKMNVNLPKVARFTLGIKVERLIIDLLETLFLAQNETGDSKIIVLKDADVKLKLIKLMIRLASEVKAIDQQKYIALETRILEIGKMLGGWIKYTNAKRP